MTLAGLREKLTQAVLDSPDNAVRTEYALRAELVGTPYYEGPLVGCAAADDPLFAQFKADPKIYGSALWLPEEWLPGARSVVSFFLPFSEEVLRLLKQYGVKLCCYGHLHGPAHRLAVRGMAEGMEFSMVSADYLGFRPKKIAD